MKRSMIILMIGTIILVALFTVIAMTGCGGGGSGGGGSDEPTSTPTATVSPTNSPTSSPTPTSTPSPTASPTPSPTSTGSGKDVTGYVRDENGIPVSGAAVKALEKGERNRAYETTTDSNGRFSLGDVPYGSFMIQISSSGHKTLNAEGFTSSGDYDALSFIQASGSGETTMSLPAPITLSVNKSGGDVNLSWTAGSSTGFKCYLVMRSRSSGVTVLSDNVGCFKDVSGTSMTDRGLIPGTYYYRVFQVSEASDTSRIEFGSNEESIGLNSGEAFPDRVAMLMLKTLPNSGGYLNQARYVVTTSDISQIIPQGITVAVSSPLFGQATGAQYVISGYKKIKNYYYGNPAHALGEISMPGEWESKYFVSSDDFAASDVVGSHKIRIDNGVVDFGTFTDSMPQSAVYNPQLTRNSDGNIDLTWSMYQDGSSFSGGSGSYGWKYLVKVMYEGAYADGTNSDYQYEKFWSNVCIRDMGFNQICDVVRNMPLDTGNKVVIPDGIFEPGTSVTVSVYAISTDRSYNDYDSGVSDYGKSYMYWLYLGGITRTIPSR